MLRQTSLSLACLLAGISSVTAEVLVNTKLYPEKILNLDETLQLNLQDHFERFADPGPVATFTLYMPVQDGFKELYIERASDGTPLEEGLTESLMTYKLTSGETYNNPFAVFAEDFVWQEYSVDYNLLADQAPVTVANFMTYVNQGSLNRTIVHRSEIDVLQAGALRLYDGDEYLLEWIDTLPPIVLEQTVDNTAGTLAMARQTSPNTATSQFFINLADNSSAFGNAYSVFGQLADQTNDLPLLQEMGDAAVFNLTSIFRNAPVSTIPLYTPYWDDKGSYVRFQSISVTSGNPEGVTYSWEFVDLVGEDGTDEDKAEQAAHQAVFDISIDGGVLNVSRHDSGAAVIDVTGSWSGQDRTFRTVLRGYNAEALKAFPSYSIEQEGWMVSAWYGRMQAEYYPSVFHENHGTQYINRVTDEATGGIFFYIHDSRLKSWIWTTASLYPTLYVYELNAWVEYVEGTGNGLNDPRWFWNYTTEEWFNDAEYF